MLKRTVGIAVACFATLCSVANAADLPAVPAALKSAGVLKVGVRCDQPPYGFKDGQGNFAGIETQIALQIGEWALGSRDKVELTCVSAENRIPQLLGKKVDLLLATLGVNPERARVIDFSDAYRWDGSDVLVRQDSPIKKKADLAGKEVLMLKGTTQAKWFEDHMPDVKSVRLNATSDALQSLKQGRSDAWALDIALLVSIAKTNPDLRRLNDPFALTDAAAGLRKNEPEMMAYVNAALARMKAEGMYRKWAQAVTTPDNLEFYVSGFETPRPAE